MGHFIPKRSEKEIISIRIDINMRKEIDDTAVKTHMSRNALINQCMEYAMKHLGEINLDKAQKSLLAEDFFSWEVIKR